MKDVLRSCGCSWPLPRKATRVATDTHVPATPEELDSIRRQLEEIERMLAVLFGEAYTREPQSLKARRDAGDLIERHFEGIVDQWGNAIDHVFQRTIDQEYDRAGGETRMRPDRSNALIRFINHLRDPDDLETYVYLRRHCQEGMLSRAKPSQFNTVHIALKQVILNHVRANLHGRRMEIVRDAVVAAVDERRLMVSQFYIESREAALRASEEKYRNSINHAPDAMYEIDPDTAMVLGANDAAMHNVRLLGGSPEDTKVVGRKLTELVTPEMAADTLRHLQTVVAQGTDRAFDLPIGDRYFDVNSAVIPYGNKRFVQMILHDVTQKRELMNELLKAERLAAAGTFAAGVAHEVNNPLASISSLVQSLLGGENDTSRRMTLHTILSQITRISATLKDLVNFARPAASQHSGKPVNLNDLVDETLRLVAYNKRFNGITIEPHLEPNLRQAFVDQNEIQQVLLNLLINAADASQGAGGIIKVVTKNPADQNGDRQRVLMKIIDNGIGIPREHLERVFDPFFTTKPAGAGVGLGLSLCQRIILANFGAIRIDSEVGKGTTVTVGLPVHVPQAATEASAAQ
jgi:PAS domain S-box-containing protein